MKGITGAIVLAAGFSNRFGSVKLCAELANGNSIFGQTLERISAAVPDVLIVTRPDILPLLPQCDFPIEVFDEAELGMGATLAYAASLIKDWEGCLVCLADMPFIEVSTYQQLAAQLSPDSIIVPTHLSKAGNPVGFGSDFFSQLRQLTGDAGGRSIIQSNPDAVTRLEVTDAAVLHDIDTPEDLTRYQALNQSSQD